MKGGRSIIFLLIVIALAVIAFLLLRRGGSFPRLLGPRQNEPVVPIDLQRFIPGDWEVQGDDQFECSFDNDNDLERLLIYRYNSTRLQKPLEDAGELETFAPFGGVIFDTQSSSLEPQPSPPGAYRPGNIVPYLLLPDFYPDKGEGYLGDTDVQIRYAPAASAVAGANCKATEINIFGYTYGPLPTRLSIFRWMNRETGYQGVHYAGSARVEWEVTQDSAPERADSIKRITTYNRLLNHRSVLCEVNAYVRPDATQLTFISEASVRTIDFCFDTPSEPMYPEGVVVALLRGKDGGTGSPSDFLLGNARLPADLDLRNPARPKYNILSVGNPSFVTPLPADGRWCDAEQLRAPTATATPTVAPTGTVTSASAPALWCGRERVRIETRIVVNGAPRDVGWSLISVRPDAPGGGVYWRIQEAELR